MDYEKVSGEKITFEALCKLAKNSNESIEVYIPQLDEKGLEIKSNSPYGSGAWLEFDSGHSPDEILRTIQGTIYAGDTPADSLIIYTVIEA